MTGLWVGLELIVEHPPTFGRSVAGVQLELVGGITLLGLAALGTVVTFAGRSDRSTALVCLRQNWGKVGNFFFGFLLGTALTDVYFYLVDPNSLLAAVDASRARISITSFSKCVIANAKLLGGKLGGDSRSCPANARHFPFTLPATTLVGF